MDVLPSIAGFEEFRRISFSDFVALRHCTMKAMSDNLLLSCRMPEPWPTRATVVGSFHHQAMELATYATTPESLEQELEHRIGVLQEYVSRWPHLRGTGSVTGWDEINRSYICAVRWARSRPAIDQMSCAKSETLLTSRDGLLVGKPDFFSLDGNRARLREFKTSSLRCAQGDIRPEYVDQLKFYSALLAETYAVRFIDATLESFTGESWSLAVTSDEAIAFGDEVRNFVRAANQRIANARTAIELTNVAADGCSYCRKQVICEAFKRAQSDIELEESSYVLDAKLERVGHGSSPRVSDLELKECHTNRNIRLVVPSEVGAKLSGGGRYVFSALTRDRSGFRWTASARVFSHA
jgi:hypothetical protein